MDVDCGNNSDRSCIIRKRINLGGDLAAQGNLCQSSCAADAPTFQYARLKRRSEGQGGIRSRRREAGSSLRREAAPLNWIDRLH